MPRDIAFVCIAKPCIIKLITLPHDGNPINLIKISRYGRKNTHRPLYWIQFSRLNFGRSDFVMVTKCKLIDSSVEDAVYFTHNNSHAQWSTFHLGYHVQCTVHTLILFERTLQNSMEFRWLTIVMCVFVFDFNYACKKKSFQP